jgi:hypothetical protein
VPAHHHALRGQYYAPADSTLNIGSCFQRTASRTTWPLLRRSFCVDPHNADLSIYTCTLCCHFRALPLEGRSGIFTIALCYWHCTTRACSITFSAYTIPFGIHHSYWRLISGALSIWASIKALPSPVSASSIKPPSEKPLRPRKAPVLYGVILQAIVLKCTISNTWLVRLTRRSRVFRLV